ncbi:hypothetical protein AB0B25_11900 [Nocardia sp. NPDC049190]|uniref:hypothetical protein n=1 Tax=Nocardia sp. NPDC049190 TaxID=3155650 RepID=UPI0033E83C36
MRELVGGAEVVVVGDAFLVGQLHRAQLGPQLCCAVVLLGGDGQLDECRQCPGHVPAGRFDMEAPEADLQDAERGLVVGLEIAQDAGVVQNSGQSVQCYGTAVLHVLRLVALDVDHRVACWIDHGEPALTRSESSDPWLVLGGHGAEPGAQRHGERLVPARHIVDQYHTTDPFGRHGGVLGCRASS